MKKIESDQNSKYKMWQSLKTSKAMKKNGLCLISGDKFIPEIWPLVKNDATVLCYEHEQVAALKPESHQVFVLNKTLYKELNPFNSNSPIVIAKLPELKTWDAQAEVKGLELYVALSDPSNLGATLRSAEAFGVSKVILLQESANPFHTKSIKASSGSVFRLKLEKGPSIKDLNGDFVSLDKSGRNINSFDWPENLRLLVGEEGQGVPESLKSDPRGPATLQIPISSAVESLSAPIATSLALCLYRNQHKL